MGGLTGGCAGRYPSPSRARDEGEEAMIAYLRTVLFLCCMLIVLLCGIAALTITVAIVTNRLPDPQAWMAVVFFAVVGLAAGIAGRAARWDWSSD